MQTDMEKQDNGPDGWFGWIDNAIGPKPLERRESTDTWRSPWWIDYNHVPPGVGYMHLVFMLLTSRHRGENQRPVWLSELPERCVTLDEIRITCRSFD
ncbi:MAG: hypothetical protein O2856_01420 [Planctomycetota bacterium]|nr:hypothetical protein [Planctomycetota bacterium]